MKQIIVLLWVIIIILLIVNKFFINNFTNNNLTNNNIHFIHIGKTGGTTIDKTFHFSRSHHRKPPKNNNLQYIISIRHPIKRLVSAFYMAKQALDTDYSKPKPENYVSDFNKVKNRLIKDGYIYSEKIDKTIKKYNNVNDLFENIYKDDDVIYLFNNNIKHQHLSKGIGWYLDNGKFIEDYHNNILYVAKNEYLDEDIQKISDIVGIKINELKKERLNTFNYEKYLSPLAIDNIKKLLKDTDYKTLEIMNKYDLIDDEYLQYCYEYESFLV